MGLFDFIKKKEFEKINELQNNLLQTKSEISRLNNKVYHHEEELSILKRKYLKFIEIDNDEKTYLENFNSLKIEYQKKLDKLKKEYQELDVKYKNALKIFTELKLDLEILESRSELTDYGIYEPVYDFEKSEEYKELQKNTIIEEKFMIQSGTAAICSTNWFVNNSETQGRIMTRKNIKLLLRAFNGESDSLIAKVNWNNINLYLTRLEKIHKQINKLGEPNYIYISDEYYELKKKELQLEYEYKLKKYKEKEEARALLEERKEEDKVQRELEKARMEAENEELQYKKALKKVKAEIENATGIKYDMLAEKIQFLEDELKEAQSRKERAISMAQQTRRGYVYIISNIGTFGENTYKIGMTRRLEPVDRIRELSNASVPFKYDIHAMIYSEDAPTLENKLHNAFSDRRMNLMNYRKEFYEVTLEEIENEIKKTGLSVNFLKTPEARDYRETLLLREMKKNRLTEEEINEIEIMKKYPESIYYYDENEDGEV